jgi:hypothetical protein
MIYLRTKILSLVYDIIPSSIEKKKYNYLLAQCHPDPLWPPVLPLTLNLEKAFSQ